MAQLGSYAQALGGLAKEAAVGGLKGFAQGMKMSAMREMPALTAGVAFAKDVRSRAAKIEDAKSSKNTARQVNATENLVKQQVANNVISLDMARNLRMMNQNIRTQTSLLNFQVQSQKQQQQFAEEADREAKAYQEKMLAALRRMSGQSAVGGGGTAANDADGGGGGGIWGSILGLLGDAAIGYGLGRRGTRALGRRSLGAAAKRFGTNFFRGGVGKVLGKVGGRLIPYAGWGLLGYDLYDAFYGDLGGPGGPGSNAQAMYAARLFANRNRGRAGTLQQRVTPYAPGSYRLGGGAGRMPEGSTVRPRANTVLTTPASPSEMPRSAPLSVRNNNPGNLRFSANLTGPGGVLEGAQKGEGGFAKFPTREAGMEAMRRQIALDTQKRGMTLRQFINKYAPKSENNTEAYIKRVSEMTGIKPDDKVSPDQIPALQRAMIMVEGDSRAMAYYYPGPRPNASSVGSTTSNATSVLPTVTVTAPAFNEGYKPGLNVAGSPVYQPPATRRSMVGGAIPVRGTSGTVVARESGPVPVVDEEANKKLEDLTKSQGKVEKETKGLSASQTLAARYFRKARATQRMLTPEEEADQYLKKAQQGFLNAFDRTLTKAFKDFGKTILKGYTPGGTTVTAQQAQAPGYAGQQLGKAFNIDKQTSKLLEKVLGKEYGRMMAPAVSQLGKAYLNSFAIGIGQTLFSGTLGKEGAQSITGQIIGNFAKGNKQVAMEQLLYGLTGIATGPETIAQSYGFRSAAEGIGYMAEVFAAKATNATADIFGWENRVQAQQVRGPDGRMYTPGEGLFGGVVMPGDRGIGYGGLNAQKYGISRAPSINPLRTEQMTTMVGQQGQNALGFPTLNGVPLVSVVNAGDFASENDKMKAEMMKGLTMFATTGVRNVMDGRSIQGGITVGGPYLGTPGINGAYGNQNPYSLAKGTPDLSMTTSNQQGMVGSSVAADISDSAQVGKETYSLIDNGQRVSLNAMNDGTQSNINVTNAADRNNQVGMQEQTTQIVGALNNLQGRMGGGGGGTGIPGFTTGNPFADFAISMGTSFVTNKLTSGIKNPYLKSIANFGLNYAAQKYILPSIFGSAGGGAAAGGAGAGGLAGLGALGTAIQASLAGGFTNLAMATGSQLAGTIGASLQYGLNPFGQQAIMLGAQNAGMAGSFASGVSNVMPYAGSIIQLLSGDIKGAAISASLTYIGTAIGGPVGGFIGSVLGSVLGKGKKKKIPRYDRVIFLPDQDIAKKVTVVEQNNPSDGVKSFVDAMLNVGFNTALSIYQASKVVPKFRYIYICVDGGWIKLALPGENWDGNKITTETLGSSGGTSNFIWVSKLEDSKTSEYYMLQIMRTIKEAYKTDFKDQPDYLKKIDEGYALVASKSAGQLGGGLISNLKYGKYALNPTETGAMGTSSSTAAQSYVLGSSAGRTTVINSGGGAGVTQNGSQVVPTSGTVVSSSQLTPVSSNVVGGSNSSMPIVVSDNSSVVNEGTTVNTTYVNTSASNDIYGRSSTQTSPIAV